MREVEGGRRRMRVSPPPQSISSMPKVWLSTSSSSYSTVAFMTSTESLTYHDVESSTNGSSSTTSLDEIAVLPPPTTTTTVPTKEAAMDIQALVNDAATSSNAYAGEDNNGIDVDETPPPPFSAKDILALENEASAAAASAAVASSGGVPLVGDGSNVGNSGGGGGLPFAPMMTYQKYLTMQVCAHYYLSCVQLISISVGIVFVDCLDAVSVCF